MPIREREFAGETWFWTCRRFKDGLTARLAFNKANSFAADREGKLDAGCYRHAPPGEDQRWVTVVSRHRESVKTMEGMLGGSFWPLEDVLVDKLIERRIEVVSGLRRFDAPPGTYRIPHGKEGMEI